MTITANEQFLLINTALAILALILVYRVIGDVRGLRGAMNRSRRWRSYARHLVVLLFLGVFFAANWANRNRVADAGYSIAKEQAAPSAQQTVPQRARGAQACSVSDFDVEGFKIAIVDNCRASPCPVLKITGKLVNRCAEPAGASLQVTAYDKAGGVVDVAKGWPASIQNIQPGTNLPFNMGPLMKYREEMATFDIRVTDVKQW